MKIKNIVFGLLFLLLIQSAYSLNANIKNPEDPCSPSQITNSISRAVFQKQELVFTEGKVISIEQINNQIEKYIEEKKRVLKGDKMDDAYHNLQNKIFSAAVSSSLDSLDDKRSSFPFADKNQFPILSLYTEKFRSITSSKSQIQAKSSALVPTFLLGLEASLNYAILSCQTVSEIENFGASKFAYNDYAKNEEELMKNLLAAKRVLNYSLSAYDSLNLALPQHLAYLDLIEELKKLRKNFSKLEQISSECIVPNHYNTSCEK